MRPAHSHTHTLIFILSHITELHAHTHSRTHTLARSKQASKQASKQSKASKQASKQANKQASRQAAKQPSSQAGRQASRQMTRVAHGVLDMEDTKLRLAPIVRARISNMHISGGRLHQVRFDVGLSLLINWVSFGQFESEKQCPKV